MYPYASSFTQIALRKHYFTFTFCQELGTVCIEIYMSLKKIFFLWQIKWESLEHESKLCSMFSRDFKIYSMLTNVSPFFHSVSRQYHRATMFFYLRFIYVRLQSEYVQPTQHAVTGWRVYDRMSLTTIRWITHWVQKWRVIILNIDWSGMCFRQCGIRCA